MNIVADENLDQSIINFLNKNGFDVYSVAKSFSGATDKEVLKKTSELNGILLTEDKDFGEIIFSYNIQSLSVIFLRYQKMELDAIKTNILKVLKSTDFEPPHKFITISANKIRTRIL